MGHSRKSTKAQPGAERDFHVPQAHPGDPVARPRPRRRPLQPRGPGIKTRPPVNSGSHVGLFTASFALCLTLVYKQEYSTLPKARIEPVVVVLRVRALALLGVWAPTTPQVPSKSTFAGELEDSHGDIFWLGRCVLYFRVWEWSRGRSGSSM